MSDGTKSDETVTAKEALRGLIEYYEQLEPHIMTLPVSHYDLLSVMLLLEARWSEESADIKSSNF